MLGRDERINIIFIIGVTIFKYLSSGSFRVFLV